jgi:hypothetical protein
MYMTRKPLFLVAICSVLACSSGDANTGAGDESASGGSPSGGTASGGSAPATSGKGGMAASGGSGGMAATGGSGGMLSGAGGQGASAGGVASPECTKDEDCKLIDTCCDCAGVPKGSDLPCANTNCKATTCQLLPPNPVAALCRAGQCVTNVNCARSGNFCKKSAPQCPAGQTGTIDGMCWGPCAVATECSAVDACTNCDTSACVQYATQIGPEYHCVDIPAVCGSLEDCTCMGPAVCVNPYDSCGVSAAGLVCSCPTC